MSDIIIMVSIVVYLLVVVAIGIQYSKKNKSSDDFYLGGRKLGPFVTAMSAEASDMSSWLLMGLPGVAYLTGVADAAWTAIGLAIGTYINWLIVAKRIRMYSQGYDAFTVPDFFSKRFGGCKTLSCIAAIMIVVFFVPYTASGFAYKDNRGQVYNGQVIRNTGLSKGKYMAGSLRQIEALQELVNHLQQNGQEVPSSIDIIITQEGYRIKTIFNYNEDTSNLPAYLEQYEQQNFPTMK